MMPKYGHCDRCGSQSSLELYWEDHYCHSCVEVKELEIEVGRMGHERRDMLALLREIEYSISPIYNEPVCPVCKNQSAHHAPDCKLDAMKRRLE